MGKWDLLLYVSAAVTYFGAFAVIYGWIQDARGN